MATVVPEQVFVLEVEKSSEMGRLSTRCSAGREAQQLLARFEFGFPPLRCHPPRILPSDEHMCAVAMLTTNGSPCLTKLTDIRLLCVNVLANIHWRTILAICSVDSCTSLLAMEVPPHLLALGTVPPAQMFAHVQ
eukprot:5799090-Amphidinium_carterae.1